MEKADTGEFVSGVAGDYNSLLSAEMVKEINEICGRYPGSTKVINGFAVWTPLLGLWKCASRNVFIARFILSRLNEVRGPKQIASYIQQLRASATQDWGGFIASTTSNPSLTFLLARKLSSRKPHSSKELDIPSWLSSFARPFPDGTLAYSPPEVFVSQPTLELNVLIDLAAAPQSFAEIFIASDTALQQRAFLHPTDGLGGLRLLSPCRLGHYRFEFEAGQLLDDVDVFEEDKALLPQGSYNYESDVVFWRYSIPPLPSSICEKIASRTGAWSIRHRVYILGLKDQKPFAELVYCFSSPVDLPAPASDADVQILEAVGRVRIQTFLRLYGLDVGQQSQHLAGMNVFSVSSSIGATLPVKSRRRPSFVAKSVVTPRRTVQRRNTIIMDFKGESDLGIVYGENNFKAGGQVAGLGSPYELDESQDGSESGAEFLHKIPLIFVHPIADKNQTKKTKCNAEMYEPLAEMYEPLATASVDNIADASTEGPRYSTYSSLASWNKMPSTPKPTPSNPMMSLMPGSIGPQRTAVGTRARVGAPFPDENTRIRLTLMRAAKESPVVSMLAHTPRKIILGFARKKDLEYLGPVNMSEEEGGFGLVNGGKHRAPSSRTGSGRVSLVVKAINGGFMRRYMCESVLRTEGVNAIGDEGLSRYEAGIPQRRTTDTAGAHKMVAGLGGLMITAHETRSTAERRQIATRSCRPNCVADRRHTQQAGTRWLWGLVVAHEICYTAERQHIATRSCRLNCVADRRHTQQARTRWLWDLVVAHEICYGAERPYIATRSCRPNRVADRRQTQQAGTRWRWDLTTYTTGGYKMAAGLGGCARNSFYRRETAYSTARHTQQAGTRWLWDLVVAHEICCTAERPHIATRSCRPNRVADRRQTQQAGTRWRWDLVVAHETHSTPERPHIVTRSCQPNCVADRRQTQQARTRWWWD
ncbi:hypothetical protein C8F01DRAFT_1092447 [Mycena amicta]|nr:hypothetical protein C8F01DRAFT_1092447 [Mycena amicta]